MLRLGDYGMYFQSQRALRLGRLCPEPGLCPDRASEGSRMSRDRRDSTERRVSLRMPGEGSLNRWQRGARGGPLGLGTCEAKMSSCHETSPTVNGTWLSCAGLPCCAQTCRKSGKRHQGPPCL